MKKRILGMFVLAVMITGCNPRTSSFTSATGNMMTVSPSSTSVTSEVSSVEESSKVASSEVSSTNQESSSTTNNKVESENVHSTGTGWLPPI